MYEMAVIEKVIGMLNEISFYNVARLFCFQKKLKLSICMVYMIFKEFGDNANYI